MKKRQTAQPRARGGVQSVTFFHAGFVSNAQ